MSYILDVTDAKTIFGTILLDNPGHGRIVRTIADRGNDNDDDDPPPIGAISRRPPPTLLGGVAEEPPLSLELEIAT
jgi:hypothetical protein